MLKFSTFDEEDFKAVDANDLRVKITTNVKESFIDGGNVLRLSYKGGTGKLDESMLLSIMDNKQKVQSHWFSDDSLVNTTLFKLNAESIEAFKRIQASPLLFQKNQSGEFTFSVSWQLEGGNTGKHLVKVELLFEPEDGFFTLIDDFEVDYEKLRKEPPQKIN